jgi:hypothetical protein
MVQLLLYFIEAKIGSTRHKKATHQRPYWNTILRWRLAGDLAGNFIAKTLYY